MVQESSFGARLRALMEERGWSYEQLGAELGMNPQTLKVTLNNEPLDLTSMEFQLLYHLARGAGRIFSREDLLNLFAEKEWNKFDRCVDVHISSLRKKLGDNSRCPTYLKTVRGLGYMFIKQSDAWP